MTARSSLSLFSNFLGLLVPVIIVSACGTAKEVSFKSGGVNQTFTQGAATVPADFQTFVYPDATASGSVSADGENDEQSKFMMLTSKSPIDTIKKWYQDKFKSEDWKITNFQEQPKLISITGSKANTELSVMITEDNGTTSISLSLAKQIDSNYNEEPNKENFVPNKDTPPTD